MAGAESKRKTYACLVELSRPCTDADLAALNAVRDLRVLQQTPVRVLHRRTQMVREKVVHWMRAERVSRRCLTLRMSTSAGAYVKEIVHGDRGRTSPSVAGLLSGQDDGDVRADILQLDVEEILM